MVSLIATLARHDTVTDNSDDRRKHGPVVKAYSSHAGCQGSILGVGRINTVSVLMCLSS